MEPEPGDPEDPATHGTAGSPRATGPPVLTGVALGDEPAVWERLGFAVVDGRVSLSGVDLHLTGEGGGILGWQLEPAVVGDLDGLASRRVGPPTSATVAHPNGVVGVDHVVAATDDHERLAAALATVGLSPRRTVDGARGDTATRYRFTLLGTCLLEAIGPREPTGSSRPTRFVGLALVAPDLGRLEDFAGEARPAVQPGRWITTVRRELGVGVPLAVLTPRR